MSGNAGPDDGSGQEQAPAKVDPTNLRDQDAIYQGNQLVARVTEPEVDLEAKEISFKEIYQSDYLLLPDECEFQDFKILVQKIESATTVGTRGRILTQATAEILGYREQ